jgi:hypothetical protein
LFRPSIPKCVWDAKKLRPHCLLILTIETIFYFKMQNAVTSPQSIFILMMDIKFYFKMQSDVTCPKFKQLYSQFCFQIYILRFKVSATFCHVQKVSKHHLSKIYSDYILAGNEVKNVVFFCKINCKLL